MTKPASPDDVPVVLIALIVTLMAAVAYFLFLFTSALVGLVRQLADPAAVYESNATLLLATYPPWLGLAYAFLPELADRHQRLLIASRIALVPTILLPLTCGFLLPGMASTQPWPFAGTLFLVFCGIGALPTLALARAYVSADRDTHIAAAGDHYVDTTQLDTETKRLVAKHAPALKAPPGWRPPALFGAKDALTHSDLRRILSLEEEEARRLRDIHETRAVTAREARHDAHHTFILSLSPQEKALFEATLRADVEAVNGMTAYKEALATETVRLSEENHNLRASIHASTELERELQEALAQVDAQHKEIAALTNTIDTLHSAAADRDALERSLAASERTRAGQAHEIEWLWGEWERHAPHPAPRERQSAAKRPPTVVPLDLRRSSWSAAAPTPYGGRS